MPPTITMPDSNDNHITYFNKSTMEFMIQESMMEIAKEMQQHQNIVTQQLQDMRQQILAQMQIHKEALRMSIVHEN